MDMLKMGRGGGEWQETDLNVLLNDHVLLAFHSARAADTEFQLDILEEYEEDLVKVKVRPQDLGRVFLNLVTNACYATDEKRKLLLEEGGDAAKDYLPTINLRTQRVGDHVEICLLYTSPSPRDS